MMPNENNDCSDRFLSMCRGLVDRNVSKDVLEQAREILTYAICVLLSIDDFRIQEIISNKLPDILQSLNIFIGDKKKIQDIRKKMSNNTNITMISVERKNKFSNDVLMERYVDFNDPQSFFNKNEVKYLFISLDEGSDYYRIIEQVALELLFLIRHHIFYNIHYLEVESGLEKISFDNYMGSIGPTCRRHIEEYLSIWYIENAMKNCRKRLKDPSFETICQDSELKNSILDSRVADVLNRLNLNDVYNKMFVFVFDRKNEDNFFDKKYLLILPDVIQKLDTFDGLLRMIQDSSCDNETKNRLYRICLSDLEKKFAFFAHNKMNVYKSAHYQKN